MGSIDEIQELIPWERKIFACSVVLYHPTAEQLETIVLYASVFDKVYVFDNTEYADAAVAARLAEIPGVILLSSGENKGLPVAYNAFAHAAIADGYQWLATYDQDSRPTRESLIAMQEFILAEDATDVAAYGPRYYEPEGMTAEERAIEAATVRPPLESVDWVISSGMFINLAIYAQTDGFDEKLFIDMVDADYCCTVRALGYRVIINNAIVLEHCIGYYIPHGKRLVQTHNAIRCYYILRNTLYFRQKHGLEQGCIWYYVLDRIRHMLRYDDDKLTKLKLMVRAYIDFKKQRMGKLDI